MTEGSLSDRVAIVTGGARGIGRATAEMLVSRGARVVLSDVDGEVVREAAAALGEGALPCAGDLVQPGAPERLVDAAIAEFGRLDIVVNNAGYTFDGVIHKMSDEQFQAMLDIHCVAPFRLLRAASPFLRDPAKRERESGVEVFRKVVNVSSIAGTMGNAGQANYATAKAGIVGLTKALAKEWGPLKINVNAVAFGMIETRLSGAKENGASVMRDGREVPIGIPEASRSGLATMIPLGRAGTAAEAAGAVTFLCSPESNYVHGQVLNVTGGVVFGMGD
jgi:3-oxoacyl-[acyl-carrier protein] reductase